MFCETISKYLILAVQLKKTNDAKWQCCHFWVDCECSNFIPDCKQMQAHLTSGKYINLKPKKNQQTCCKIGLNHVGESSRNSNVKQCLSNLVFLCNLYRDGGLNSIYHPSCLSFILPPRTMFSSESLHAYLTSSWLFKLPITWSGFVEYHQTNLLD